MDKVIINTKRNIQWSFPNVNSTAIGGGYGSSENKGILDAIQAAAQTFSSSNAVAHSVRWDGSEDYDWEAMTEEQRETAINKLSKTRRSRVYSEVSEC